MPPRLDGDIRTTQAGVGAAHLGAVDQEANSPVLGRHPPEPWQIVGRVDMMGEHALDHAGRTCNHRRRRRSLIDRLAEEQSIPGDLVCYLAGAEVGGEASFRDLVGIGDFTRQG